MREMDRSSRVFCMGITKEHCCSAQGSRSYGTKQDQTDGIVFPHMGNSSFGGKYTDSCCNHSPYA